MLDKKTKEINIKNRTYYYLRDLESKINLDFENNVFDEKSHQIVYKKTDEWYVD